jgi:hypothetical protein
MVEHEGFSFNVDVPLHRFWSLWNIMKIMRITLVKTLVTCIGDTWKSGE